MALIEIHVEKERPHLRPDFGPTDLADMLGVSMTRLYQLFRHQTIHRTPEAYIDNLRTLAALRLLREKPNYRLGNDPKVTSVRQMFPEGFQCEV